MNVIPADSTPNQQMTIRWGDDVLRLTLTWNSIGSHWYADIYDVQTGEWVARYLPLDVGIPIGRRFGRDWVLMVADLSAVGLDPMAAADMGKRCVLAIESFDEIESVVADLQQ